MWVTSTRSTVSEPVVPSIPEFTPPPLTVRSLMVTSASGVMASSGRPGLAPRRVLFSMIVWLAPAPTRFRAAGPSATPPGKVPGPTWIVSPLTVAHFNASAIDPNPLAALFEAQVPLPPAVTNTVEKKLPPVS